METGRDAYEGALKNRAIPVDEPVFILRAQDAAASDTVRFWAATSAALGAPVAVIEQALQQGDRMDRWPVKKVADADHVADPAVLEQQFAERQWSVEPRSADALATIAEAKARSAGFEAGRRSVERTFEGLRGQVEDLRRELAKRPAPVWPATVILPRNAENVRPDPVAYVLSMASMPWILAAVAVRLRAKGREIPTKTEAELAAALHFLVGLALEYGDRWSDEVDRQLLDREPGPTASTVEEDLAAGGFK